MAITDTFDGVASMLTHGGAAQDYLIQMALPYASAYYSAALTILEPVALVGLIASFVMWFVFPTGQIKNFFIGLLIAVILLAPGEYSTGDSALWFSSSVPSNPADITGRPAEQLQYPKSIVVFLNVLGALERGLYQVVNTAMEEFDGEFRDGILPSRLVDLSNDSTVLATASPELLSLHRLYRGSCEARASDEGLNSTQMQAVGFQNGMMLGARDGDVVSDPLGAVPWFNRFNPFASTTPSVSGDDVSNSTLSRLKASASESGVFLAKGSLIPSKRYYLARQEGAAAGNDAFLSRSEMANGSRFANPNPMAASQDERRFYASDCDELHDMVQQGNRQYYAFIRQMEIEKGNLVKDEPGFAWLQKLWSRTPTATNNANVIAGLSDPKFFHSMNLVNRAVAESNGYQGLGGNKFGDNDSGIGSAFGAGAKAVGLELSSFWKKWNLDLAAPAVMGVVAMGMALLFMMMPLLIAFAVLPGRLDSLTTVIKLILFAKLTLLLMYITCRVSTFVTASSVFTMRGLDGTSTSLYAAQLSLAMTSQLVSLIAILTAAPMLAYFLVFSETKGLSSMQPGSIGKEATRNSLIAAGVAAKLASGGIRAAKVTPPPSPSQGGGGANGQSLLPSPGRGVPSK